MRAARETAHKEDRTERPRQTTPTPPTRTRARSEGDAPAPSRRGGGPRAASADLADLLQSLGRGAAARTSSAPGADEPAGSAGLHAAPDQLAGAPQRDADSAPAVRPHAADRTADRTATTPRDPAPEPTRHELTRRETTPTSSAAAAAATIRPLPVQDLRRTFSALPQRPAHEGDFAETWWGNAWVRALEEVAADPARLKRGRGYADQGHVEAITVTPGNVLAYVQGSRQRPYRTRIRLRTLDDADWERFLDAAADHPGHLAALLDRELPHGLADLAAGLGVDLLPGPGELQPDCSCPDFGHPCKHAAALCYQTARLLDTDPFVLLLLRGRGEHWLLDTLARRNAHRAARAESAAPPMPGVRATEALGQRVLPPLPAPLPRLVHAGRPPAYPAAPGGPDPLALDQLATDAAARAHAFLITGEDTIGGLTLWQDAVRIAAGQPGSGLTGATRALYAQLAAAADRSTTDLARAVAAWRQGGLDGLTVLDEPWNPPAGPFDQARPALLAAEHPAFRPWRNHLTHPAGHLQLRYGRDGYWYPYEAEPGTDDWWPRGTRDLDPVGALSG
ncbi:SWIM zinc finger family protein [Streptomyces sp. NPDC050418]|uniref:SWIM zinc finger family protein n=1 Tax=Streptomyces sp. NPDC050418 TaxID=3365612 RepID=UPI0037B56617